MEEKSIKNIDDLLDATDKEIEAFVKGKSIKEIFNNRKAGKWFKTKEELKSAVELLPCDSYVILTVTNYKKVLEDERVDTENKIIEKIEKLWSNRDKNCNDHNCRACKDLGIFLKEIRRCRSTR